MPESKMSAQGVLGCVCMYETDAYVLGNMSVIAFMVAVRVRLFTKHALATVAILGLHV